MTTFTDNTAILILGFMFNYFVLYKKNKFIGSVMFLVMSSLLLLLTSVEVGIAMILIFASLTSLILELIGAFTR